VLQSTRSPHASTVSALTASWAPGGDAGEPQSPSSPETPLAIPLRTDGVAKDPLLEEEEYDAANRGGADDSEDEDELGVLEEELQERDNAARIEEFTESAADPKEDNEIEFFRAP
jgi:hypothetical protein